MKNRCKHCHSQNIIKSRFTSYNKQRYFCKSCKRKFIEDYTYHAYNESINEQIIFLTKKGLGIRSTARVLKISTTTVLKRILYIASIIKQPQIIRNQTYQVDELRTYISNKKRPIWVIYAINSETKFPVCLKVGRRNKRNLKVVIDTLLLSNSK